MQDETKNKTVEVEPLRKSIASVLSQFDLKKKHIEYIVEGLMFGSLRGVDTHGVELLKTYIKELKEGRSKIQPEITVEIKNSVVLVDADHAIGMVAGREGIEKGIDVCREMGVATVFVSNSNHFGMASIYSMQAAKQGLIGLVMSHADALIAPYNAKEALLGTNPLSIAAPAKGSDVFCFDMAASQVSYSLVKGYLNAGKKIPQGWAIDETGKDSSITQAFHALQPLGGYKGQGIGMMVTILAGILSGMPLDFEMSHLYSPPYDEPRLTGHFFLLIDPEKICGEEFFRESLQRFLDRIRECEPADPEKGVFAPGDIEAKFEKDRLKNGVQISQELSRILFN